MIKDEIESIFIEIESKVNQLKKIIWVETDRKEDEKCLHYSYDKYVDCFNVDFQLTGRG